ncbi:PIN domain-containing protein [Floridanema aerugineum]|uniref:PIN domain-containing protein n=1 Tax=Floridaenema aerugineum BLCC-F46 TaxID=3153654 RepID=A0ABV4X678_9CYAN
MMAINKRLRLYLDTSVFNRPFDDQSQVKIFLETQAMLLILQMIQNKQVELVNSNILEYENSRNSDPDRAKAVELYLSLASDRQIANELIRQRAKELEQNGVKAMDALHIACAEAANSDYFLTCDKRLINKCKSLSLKVMNPADFILEIEDESKPAN